MVLDPKTRAGLFQHGCERARPSGGIDDDVGIEPLRPSADFRLDAADARRRLSLG